MCKSGKNQTCRERESHSLFGHKPARRRLKSRRSFLTCVQPVHFPSKVVRVNEWKRRLEEKAHAGLVNLYEDLVTGHDSPWLNWRCLNRLRTGYTCGKEQRKKWGYFNGDTTCECGLATANTSHMLQCTLLAHLCTLDDLLEFNDTAHRAMEEDSLMIRNDDDQTINMSAIHSQSSSDALILISANIEGLTANKASILSEVCMDKHCHCLCLQQTHRSKDQARPSIPGMALVAVRPHNKLGNSVFVRDGLKINSISVCEEDNVEFITVELPGVMDTPQLTTTEKQ